MDNTFLTNQKRVNFFPKALVIISIFLITFIIFGFFSTIGVDPHHDGLMFKTALDVAKGKMLFRDTFTQYGVLVHIIHALLLNILGEYLIVIKIATVFFYALIFVFLFLVLKRIIPRILTVISIVVWLLLAPFYIMIFLPWPSVYALFFQLLCVWLLMRWLETRLSLYIFLTGITTALVFLCRQPVGFFTFTAMAFFYLYLFLQREISIFEFRKILLNYAAAYFAIFSIFLIWLLINNALIDWWKQSIIMPFLWAVKQPAGINIGSSSAAVSQPFIGLDNLGIGLVSTRGFYVERAGLFLYLARAIVYFWFLLPFLSFIRNRKNIPIVLFSIICIASGLQIYPVRDIRHIYWSFVLMPGIIALLVYQFTGKFFKYNPKVSKKAVLFISASIFILIFLLLTAVYLIRGIDKAKDEYYFADKPLVLKGMRLTKKERDFYQRVYQKIEKYFMGNPSGNVLIDSGNMIFLTFDNRIKNIHPIYFNLSYSPCYPEYQKIRNEYILSNNPLILLDNLE